MLDLAEAIHMGYTSTSVYLALHFCWLIYYVIKNYATFDEVVKPFLNKMMITASIIIIVAVGLNVIYAIFSFTLPLALSPVVFFMFNMVTILDNKELLFNRKSMNEIEDGPQISYEDLSKYYEVTEREYEIMLLISDGCTNQIIAEKLNISPNTVRNHIARVFKKLGVANRFELMNYMMRGKLPDNFEESE